MKKSATCQSIKKLVSLLFITILLFSCEKSEQIQKFDDVFDTSGIDVLNEKIAKAVTMDDLTELGHLSEVEIPQELKNVGIDAIVAHYMKNIELSADEIDMLLKNDSETYLKVINRLCGMPEQIQRLNLDFDMVKSSPLNSYLLKQKADLENFYSDDYYSAILALQDFISNDFVESLKSGKKVKTIPPGQNKDYDYPHDQGVVVLYYKVIALNNIWDMWWAYWSDGTRSKHKGAAGSFPG